MNRLLLHCWPMLAAVFGCLPATAKMQQAEQTGESGPPPAPASAPCLRTYCGAISAIAEPAAAGVVPAAPTRPSWQRGGAREWDEQMGARRPAEQYNCLLSAGFGGQLKLHGYRGVKLFGQTHTVSRSGGGVAQ